MIVGVSRDLRGDSWGCVPLYLFWRENLNRDGECGFDYLTFALVSSKAHREGVGLRVADSHTGNHPEGGFTPLETIQRLLVVIGRRSHSGFEREAFEPGDEGTSSSPPLKFMSAKDTIAVQRCGLSAKELNEFLSSYPIPSEYEVILPTSTQTIFDSPPGYVGLYNTNDLFCSSKPNLELPLIDFFCEMDFRIIIYTENDYDFAFLPKEPSLGFGIGSPPASVNIKPPKDVEEPEVQPVEVTADSGESPKAGMFVVHPRSVAVRIKERKCKTWGGSSRPHVKRKLASGSLSSRVVHAKTSASKDDAPFLSISDDDEGLPDYFKFKDANACHLKIYAITPPAWKGHFDNQMDLELLDLHDRCYTWQAMVDNTVNRRAREFLQVIERISGEADVIKNSIVLALRENISSLTADVKEHKGNLDRMMLESQKWAVYQVTLSTLESKVNSLEADKARLEDVEASLRKEVEELKQPWSWCIVAAMKEPFLLIKRPKDKVSSYQKDPNSCAFFLESYLSFAPSSNLMSPPADLVKPSA
ncbi:hypothetical protein Tco_1343782 [Tanacetum coccineum]